MTRPRTDPGHGYSHTDDHCDLCASQAGWACTLWEKYEDRIEVLLRKRADSEIRDQEAEKRAKFYRWLVATVATGGFAPWVYVAAKWLLQQTGG